MTSDPDKQQHLEHQHQEVHCVLGLSTKQIPILVVFQRLYKVMKRLGRPEKASRAPRGIKSINCSKRGGAYFQVENVVALMLYR